LITTSSKSLVSKFGGNPLLPPNFEWPVGLDGRPLEFLCQIALNEIGSNEVSAQLPKTGILSFFYDCEEMRWGIEQKDRHGWRVLHFPDASQLSPMPIADRTRELSPTEMKIEFRAENTFPDLNSEEVSDWELADDDADAYSDFVEDSYGDKHPLHRICGHAQLIQNDLLLDCEVSSTGRPYTDLSPQQREATKDAWMLLLQIDTDDDLGIMWGDAGMIYFCIRRSDLQAGAFDNVWLILQCY
jgi:uncharacterized protein YwqG